MRDSDLQTCQLTGALANRNDEWFAASRECKCCEGYVYRSVFSLAVIRLADVLCAAQLQEARGRVLDGLVLLLDGRRFAAR